LILQALNLAFFSKKNTVNFFVMHYKAPMAHSEVLQLITEKLTARNTFFLKKIFDFIRQKKPKRHHINEQNSC